MHSISLASDVGIDENIVFVLGSAIMSSSKPIGVGRVNRWTRNSAQRFEDHYYEALAFFRHNIDLVFDAENMKPEILTKAPENAGIHPGTRRKLKAESVSPASISDTNL